MGREPGAGPASDAAGIDLGALLDRFSQEVAAEIGLDPRRVASRLASPATRRLESQTHARLDSQARGEFSR
ncbi:MAG: hypothetical protein L6E13_11550 [Firmicutes bacterium]|nr:hypothetical protein [Bacillota bacterium]